jgi:hypothetical protein
LIDLLLRERSKRKKPRRGKHGRKTTTGKARPMPVMDSLWNMAGLLLFLLFVAWLLSSCAVPPGTSYTAVQDVPGANATFQAAQQQAQIAAQRATAASGELTRQAVETTAAAGAVATGTAASATQTWQATADNLVVQMTANSIAVQATQQAISANATATAVYQVAQAEQRLIQDEQDRLALQRQQERDQMEYQRLMNQVVKPLLWLIFGLAVLAVAGAFAYRVYQRSNPITILDVSGPRVLIPSNSYQVLPSPRAPLALPEPAAETAVTPISLPPLTQGHVLVAGETGSGKTTAMLSVLKRRQNVTVLDPHDDNATWGDAQVIGGGRNFEAIGSYLAYMQQLLSERFTLRSQGQQVFDPLTVATDEMPAIVAALGREVGDVWRAWLREGRKVGLFFAVSTQSTRVTTLGIKGEGDLLQNFSYIIALGEVAMADYPDLVQGMARPAVIRTVQGARPVIIPHENEQPQLTAVAGNGQNFVAPEPRGLDTEWGYITPIQISQIVRMKRAGYPNSQIETTVFGQERAGGAAYHKVKAVLDSTKNGVLVG